MGQLKPLLLRIQETSALLSVGRTKVYQLIRAGILPTVPWIGDMRVPRVAVERLVANAMKPAKEAELATASEPMVEPDLSGLSDEELKRLERIGREAAPSSTPTPATLLRKPRPNRGGRPKGYPVSGAAKTAKERALERREREQKERDARWHPPPQHDAAIAWPASLDGRGGVMNPEQVGLLNARSSAVVPLGRSPARYRTDGQRQGIRRDAD